MNDERIPGIRDWARRMTLMVEELGDLVEAATDSAGGLIPARTHWAADDPEPADTISALLDIGHGQALTKTNLPYLVRTGDGWTWSGEPVAFSSPGGLPWSEAAAMAIGTLVVPPTHTEWCDRYEDHRRTSEHHGNDPLRAQEYAMRTTTGELGPEPYPQIVVDMLSLVCVTVSIDTVKEWNPSQRIAAMEWAGAVHLDASDNPDVVIPPRPAFLPKDPSR